MLDDDQVDDSTPTDALAVTEGSPDTALPPDTTDEQPAAAPAKKAAAKRAPAKKAADKAPAKRAARKSA